MPEFTSRALDKHSKGRGLDPAVVEHIFHLAHCGYKLRVTTKLPSIF